SASRRPPHPGRRSGSWRPPALEAHDRARLHHGEGRLREGGERGPIVGLDGGDQEVDPELAERELGKSAERARPDAQTPPIRREVNAHRRLVPNDVQSHGPGRHPISLDYEDLAITTSERVLEPANVDVPRDLSRAERRSARLGIVAPMPDPVAVPLIGG